MPNGNGTKYVVSLAVTVVIAVAGGAFTLGMHLGNDEIHQTEAAKSKLVHNVIDREVSPVIQHMRDDLEELKEGQKELRRILLWQHPDGPEVD